MWRYQQDTGKMFRPDGTLLAVGYSGAWDGAGDDHRNVSADQDLHALGPIPVGAYNIAQAFHDPRRGPLAMHLVPHDDNEMFGRSGFMIHGDLAPPHSGQASEGCIILPRDARAAIAASADRALVVEQSS